jgi:hypothetical protein
MAAACARQITGNTDDFSSSRVLHPIWVNGDESDLRVILHCKSRCARIKRQGYSKILYAFVLTTMIEMRTPATNAQPTMILPLR